LVTTINIIVVMKAKTNLIVDGHETLKLILSPLRNVGAVH
jgi:hypothetical protein